MNQTHTFLAAAVATMGIACGGAAFAQTPATHSSPASVSSAAAQVETWTTKQWETAKEKWAQDTTKWAHCQQQSSDRKLEGRGSWSFLYACMTT